MEHGGPSRREPENNRYINSSIGDEAWSFTTYSQVTGNSAISTKEMMHL